MKTWLWKHKGWVALSVAAATATLLAGVGLLSSSAYLISRAAQRPPILDLMVIIVGVRFFALSRAALRYLERVLSHDLTFRWLLTLRTHLYRVLEPRLPGLLLHRRSGSLLGRMVADIETLQHTYLRVFVPITAALLVGIVTGLWLHVFSPLIAWIAIGFWLLNGVVVPLAIKQFSIGIGHHRVTARAKLTAELVEQLQGMQDWMDLGRRDTVIDRIDRQSRDVGRRETQLAGAQAAQDGLSHFCAHLGMWVVLVVAIPLVHSGVVPGVQLALLTLAVLTSFEAFQNLGTAHTFLEQSRTAQHRIEAIEQTPPDVAPAPAGESETWSLQTDFHLRVEGVDVEIDDTPILQRINFSWLAGQRVGVIGPSGAGKSTLSHLLLRFRDPSRGTIKVNQRDLCGINPAVWLQQIAVVPQTTHLFNLSIRDNLRLARADADDTACWTALDQARLGDFVRGLPAGLDTWVGEHGTRLSGGERQRLAIARACLKAAPIWILDEPTSHLDARSEREIIDLLLMLTHKKSTLWITHRLIRLDELDTLLVLHRGRIEERGTHTQLLDKDGYYARMLRQQNQLLATQVD